ncbi:hypothetical protein L313_2816 [Acinetobacter haemolyticus CIP 64.3 = MTCC 9819]|uniref:Uncharacterized protein n=1 Tax=Acinetobacter haemolyticus CIP 64.3 = MTCC 9819 TaxID=1217659 RepID=N9GEV5_ACIHA|nr:hypothetical protein [Acinetobacter haemolyticus]ENW15634.1 hypothetical protein F927_03374 [Acinetobacter haemolyticus CIP 64.3 = MTCC 9819]EPR90406.1 hypothetical protein L313_2816 [Acinetobacter haemolyticus CIP 64.3 = MTCC 9819]QXZ26454.1 hypothetical protein I6L22_14990 [Acinetobacter haemolyticus]SPT48643.1 Uncharacterised protein [Acinetobacter haemolyticus]SUU61752.1 Uncharacterised protein [Acinetobacter haemolyticus]
MSVPEQTPYVEYTANGSTTNFALEFDCDKQEYLIVTLDEVEPPVGSWNLTGNSVVFLNAPSNGVKVEIKRNTPFSRTTDYQTYNNSFRPPAVNKDFDLIWWKLQELGYRDHVIWLALLKEIDDRKLADTNMLDYILNQDNALKADYIDRDAKLKTYIDQMISLVTGDPSFQGIFADFVIDGDKNQKTINAEQNERKSVKLWSDGIVDALSKYDNVDFDNNETLTSTVQLSSNKSVLSNSHTLNQTTATTIVLEADYAASDIMIDGLHILQDKSGPIGGGTDNNHAVVKIKGGTRNTIKHVTSDGQLGLSFGMGEIGASDRRSKFNTAYNIAFLNTHMGVEHIGAAYNHTRDIVVAPTEFKGIFHGIRITGYDNIENPAETAHAPAHANSGSDYYIRNMTNGISVQNSAKYNSYDRIFVTETDRALQLLQGTVVGNNPTMNHFNVIAEKVGQALVNQGGNHNDFELLVDGSLFSDQGIQELTGYTGKGFNRYSGIIKNSAKTGAQFRYSHNLYNLQVSSAVGNGVNINGSYGNGTLTVNGATGTGVSLAGNYNNLQVVATECLNALVVAGAGNTVNIQTDGNVQITGSGNTIIGRIGGNLTVTGNGNKFIGEVIGTVTRTGTTGNNFSGLKGWSETVVLSELTTDGSARITVAVPKHTSAQIRSIFATIPANTNEYELKVISISGANVVFELQNGSGGGVASTAVTFNYSYFCS